MLSGESKCRGFPGLICESGIMILLNCAKKIRLPKEEEVFLGRLNAEWVLNGRERMMVILIGVFQV